MKKMGELMKEIGFNPHASDSVKEAFIKHLIKQSNGENVQSPTQLAFSFDDEQIVRKKKNVV